MRMRLLVTAAMVALLQPLAHAGPAAPDGKTVTLTLPPQSLAQWYPPASKHRVWLHTMFGLRRAMDAMGIYIALKDQPHLNEWAGRFLKGYRSIPKMVPEWKDEVDLQWADRLEQAAAKGDGEAVGRAMRKLAVTCRSCHNDYQAVAAAIYRSPDFRQVKVEDSDTLEELPFPKVMEGLSTSLNRVIIAMKDQRYKAAKQDAERLVHRLNDLATSCENCHSDEAPMARIFGADMNATLDGLSDGIDAQDAKETGQRLAEIGVNVCARCHGVHRTLADLRHAILSSGAPPVE
jgi:nitrate/TMAO reductase-like tetraheme cytochrome c subunit